MGGKERKQFSTDFTSWPTFKYISTWYINSTGSEKFPHALLILILVSTCFIKFLEWILCQGESPFCLQAIYHTPRAFHLVVSQSDLLQITQIFFLHVRKIILNISVSSEYFKVMGDNPYFLISAKISFYMQIDQFRIKSLGFFSYRLLKTFRTFLSLQNILFRRDKDSIPYLFLIYYLSTALLLQNLLKGLTSLMGSKKKSVPEMLRIFSYF